MKQSDASQNMKYQLPVAGWQNVPQPGTIRNATQKMPTDHSTPLEKQNKTKPSGEDEKWAREEGKWAGEVGKWPGEKGALIHCWSDCKGVQPPWKSIRNVLRTNTAASGTTPGNTPQGTQDSTWQRPPHPCLQWHCSQQTNYGISLAVLQLLTERMWYTGTIEFYSAIKKKRCHLQENARDWRPSKRGFRVSQMIPESAVFGLTLFSHLSVLTLHENRRQMAGRGGD